MIKTPQNFRPAGLGFDPHVSRGVSSRAGGDQAGIRPMKLGFSFWTGGDQNIGWEPSRDLKTYMGVSSHVGGDLKHRMGTKPGLNPRLLGINSQTGGNQAGI